MSGLEWFCGSSSSEGDPSAPMRTIFNSLNSFAQNNPRMGFIGITFIFNYIFF
jgi:hypothetical protein